MTFLLKLKWDSKHSSRDKVIDTLQKNYPDRFWEILPSTNEPVLFAAATVDSLNYVDTITTEIKSLPAILYSEAIIYRPPYNYKSLRRLHLEETIEAAGV